MTTVLTAITCVLAIVSVTLAFANRNLLRDNRRQSGTIRALRNQLRKR